MLDMMLCSLTCLFERWKLHSSRVPVCQIDLVGWRVLSACRGMHAIQHRASKVLVCMLDFCCYLAGLTCKGPLTYRRAFNDQFSGLL